MTGKVSPQYSAQASVNVYIGDEISEQVTRDKARTMKAAGTHFFINHGKDLRRLAAPTPTDLVQEVMGWNMPFGRMRSSAFNEGRVGQFSIGYEIPYAFEGHLKSPRASDVNRFDVNPT